MYLRGLFIVAASPNFSHKTRNFRIKMNAPLAVFVLIRDMEGDKIAPINQEDGGLKTPTIRRHSD